MSPLQYFYLHWTYLDKTGSVQYLSSITYHLEHPVHIEMEEFSDIRFKQRVVTEFLTAEKRPPIEIHRRMQAVYGDQCVDVSIVRC